MHGPIGRRFPRFDQDRWKVVSPYLDRAMDMDDGARAAWLDALRAEDPGLAEDLEVLFAERDALRRRHFLWRG